MNGRKILKFPYCVASLISVICKKVTYRLCILASLYGKVLKVEKIREHGQLLCLRHLIEFCHKIQKLVLTLGWLKNPLWLVTPEKYGKIVWKSSFILISFKKSEHFVLADSTGCQRNRITYIFFMNLQKVLFNSALKKLRTNFKAIL